MLLALITQQIPSHMKKLKGNPSLETRSWEVEQKLLERNIIFFSGRPGLRGKVGLTALPAGNCSEEKRFCAPASTTPLAQFKPVLLPFPQLALPTKLSCSGQAVRERWSFHPVYP